LRLPLFAGAACTLLGMIHVGWLFTGWLGGRLASEHGWAYVAAIVLFVGGLLLVGLSIVGAYVGRIFEQVKDRPLYLIKERSPQVEVQVDAAPQRDRLVA
jgi:hypothetical protein